jgi:hypothetical protein
MGSKMTRDEARTVAEAYARTKLRDVERAVCDLVAITINFTKPTRRRDSIPDIQSLLKQRRDLQDELAGLVAVDA